jgi:hypothetical protein
VERGRRGNDAESPEYLRASRASIFFRVFRVDSALSAFFPPEREL